MRPGLAPGKYGPKPKALVLGGAAVGRWIAEQLSEGGFEPVFDPELARAESAEELREALRRFAALAGPSPSPFSHCVHPGATLWADRPELAQLGQELGLAVLCPPVRAISLFANRLNLVLEAESLGVPNLVLGTQPLTSVRELEMLVAGTGNGSELRLPFVLKSVRGGGGCGQFVVRQPEDLQRKLLLWMEQLRHCQGQVLLFPERYVEGARYVVAPFARFRDGRTELFPLVDSSLMSRFRKIIEFCPPQGIDPEAIAKIGDWTRRIAQHAQFVGVGAFEFLVDGPQAYLLEAVPRLNTGFHLWERVAGTRAVAWQLATLLEQGDAPQCAPLREWKSGVAVRIVSEDPLLHLPQQGRVAEVSQKREWRLPGAAADLTLALEAGSMVGPKDDGLLGILTVGARDRVQAIAVARGVLDEIWIAGNLQTNERYLAEVLAHSWVSEGLFHAAFLEEEFIPEVRPDAQLVKAAASIGARLSEPTSKGMRWAVGDQWLRGEPPVLAWRGEPVISSEALSGTIELGAGVTYRVHAEKQAPDRWLVRIGSWFLTVRRVDAAATGSSKRRKLSALVSGRVHAILYRNGAEVPAHEPWVVVESLRTLVPHALPVDGRVVSWKVGPEECVTVGQTLAELEVD